MESLFGVLIRKRLLHRCFPVKFAEFLGALILKNIHKRLLLYRKRTLLNRITTYTSFTKTLGWVKSRSQELWSQQLQVKRILSQDHDLKIELKHKLQVKYLAIFGCKFLQIPLILSKLNVHWLRYQKVQIVAFVHTYNKWKFQLLKKSKEIMCWFTFKEYFRQYRNL